MSTPLDDVDPNWAWSPFQPTETRPWSVRLVAHLYRRAGLGASWSVLQDALGKEPSEVVATLLSADHDSAAFESESQSLAKAVLATGDPKQLAAWWVYVMLRTPHPLAERMTLFWHSHFATSAAKVQDVSLMYQQICLLREYALGSFSLLVHEVAQDPAMLLYLDSATNRKAHPNENFARELMELFCLGEGNYSEQDVQQLARCFTGWEIRRGRYHFNRFQHDAGEKHVLGTSGTFPQATVIDVVLEHPAGARFIVTKLYRYLIADEPEPSQKLIEPLAMELRDSGWNLATVLRRMLSSELFFSEYALGRKIRSPVDLVIGLLRTLEGSGNTQELGNDLNQLGQGLFYPPNVSGWSGGRAWINSSTLLGRANAVQRLLQDSRTRFGGTDLATYLDRCGAASADEIVDLLAQLTLAVTPPDDTRTRLARVIDTGTAGHSQSIATALHSLSTLPEFQLC